MRLAEIMSKAVSTAKATDSAETAWQRMRLQRISHLVVMDHGEPVGIVSESDLGGEAGAPVREGRQVQDLMNGPIVTAEPTTTIREAANLMRGGAIGCLPVLDEGKLAGIVTTTDLLEVLGRGAIRPSPKSVRPVLKGRGPRRKPFSKRPL